MSKVKSIFILSFWLLILSLIVYKLYESSDRKRNSRYTIGYTLKRGSTARFGLKVKYEYFYNNQRFEGFQTYGDNDNLIIPKGRYFVVFSSKYPQNSELLIYDIVPDSIIDAPVMGWNFFPSLDKAVNR